MSAAPTTVVGVKGSTTDKGDSCCPRTTTVGIPAAAAIGTPLSGQAAGVFTATQSTSQKPPLDAEPRRQKYLSFMFAVRCVPRQTHRSLGEALSENSTWRACARGFGSRGGNPPAFFGSGYCGRTARK